MIVTLPPACGRQDAMPADGTSLNVNDFACGLAAAATAAPAEPAPTVSAVVPARPRALVAAATRVSTRRLGNVNFMIGNLLSRWRPLRRLGYWRFPGPGIQAGVRTAAVIRFSEVSGKFPAGPSQGAGGRGGGRRARPGRGRRA